MQELDEIQQANLRIVMASARENQVAMTALRADPEASVSWLMGALAIAAGGHEYRAVSFAWSTTEKALMTGQPSPRLRFAGVAGTLLVEADELVALPYGIRDAAPRVTPLRRATRWSVTANGARFDHTTTPSPFSAAVSFWFGESDEHTLRSAATSQDDDGTAVVLELSKALSIA